MKVIFAKNVGFCPGVKRAITIAENSLKKDPKPIQFLGPIIHNEKIIEKFKKQKGKFISNLKDIKPGTLILRAHGEILDEKEIPKKVLIRDTICPLVKNVHIKAQELFKNGYQVIIIGDRNHPEVKGIRKYIKNQALVIENESQARTLPKIKRIGAVSQTTQDVNKVSKILKILKSKAKELKWFNTLCPEVVSRQKELSQMAKKVKLILVIGSKTSANTKRLVQLAKKNKKRVIWVNSLEELKKRKMGEISSLGVVSGTSAPNWEIEKIKTWLKEGKQE